MKRDGTSDISLRPKILKSLVGYSKFVGPSIPFSKVNNKSQITSFLDTKIKNSEVESNIL
jgi:hypothetical protein